MRKTFLWVAVFALCLLITGCECLISGKAHATYFYTYLDGDGVFHQGTVTTNENGNGVIEEVPSDVDCNKVVFSEMDDPYLT